MFRKRYSGNRDEKNVENPCKLLETLILPNAKLQFCPEQLQNLNYIFQKRLQTEKSTEQDRTLILARSVTERLVQRLICCVGKLDERFSTKFLLTNDYLDKNPKKLQYLIRIDQLSSPQLYKDDKKVKFNIIENDPDYPSGYGRIRLHTTTLKLWQDCCNPSGYLRRDKIQTKFIELLSIAIKNEQLLQSPLDVDEAKFCGCPGKIVTPYILYRLLQIDSGQQVFYGPNGNLPRFPDPRDFQIAIIDDCDGIKMNVEFLSTKLKKLKIIVRLLLCIGLDNWPSSTDFPKRINITHTDSLLYYRSAQCGVFLVGYGVQSSGWQLRVPATEELIYHHYNENSTIWCIYDYLNYTLVGINQRRTLQKSYKILNRYIMFTLLLKQLEEDSQNPLDDLIKWSPLYLSHHILVIFDKLIGALLSQNLTNYFFNNTNLLVNPGHLCEDDYVLEAQLIQKYLLNLFDESLIPLRNNHDYQLYQIGLDSEMILLRKYRELIENFLPKSHHLQHRRRFRFFLSSSDCNYVDYTQRQLQYLSLIFENLLNYRRKILINEPLLLDNPDNFDNLEDFIFLLVLVLEQAKDEILQNLVKNPIKFRLKYNGIVAKFIENLRKNPDFLSHIDYDHNQILIENLLKCLYRLVEKLPNLTKFLKRLYEVSYINSWYLEFIVQQNDELTTLCNVIELINLKQLTPALAIIDAKNKNWIWARSILDLVELNTLRLVFIDDKQQVYRHILSLPSYPNRHRDSNRQQYEILSATSTTTTRNYFTTILRKNHNDESTNLPFYEILKNSSPLTRILNETHRHGDHRCYGDILKLLQSMQQLSMFQQAASNLPENQRKEINDFINSMRTIRTKRTIKKWSNTLPSSSSSTSTSSRTTGRPKRRSKSIPAKIERYTPKLEDSPIVDKSVQTLNIDKTTTTTTTTTTTLIKNCRITRIREDSNVLLFQNPLKTKSLLTKSQSFKM